MNFKVLATVSLAALAVGGPAMAYPHYNQPVNGGTTTLRSKCFALRDAQNRGDISRSFQLGFAIGSEHNVPFHTTPGQDCASVGVYGIW